MSKSVVISKICDYCLNQHNPQITMEGMKIIKNMLVLSKAQIKQYILDNNFDQELQLFILSKL
jgi:hypothetical protein